MRSIIEIDNLTKVYGWFLRKRSVPALDKLTLSVPEGAVFGFLGPNGAGKTTTIRLLMDLIHPTSGKALVVGRPPSDVAVKERIGFLPDSPAFSPYLTVREFLKICAKLLKIAPDKRRSRIDEVLEEVGMSRYADSKLGGFSRGMTQRIGIAQAILNHPDLLILDEPLVGLDPHGRQDLKNIISHRKKAGTTVFFCSHILSDVEKICDHVGVLNEGRLLCDGPIGSLLSVTGLNVSVAPEGREVASELLPDATDSMRRRDGGWELVLPLEAEPKVEAVLGKYPGKAVKTPALETLEEFFFRKIGGVGLGADNGT